MGLIIAHGWIQRGIMLGEKIFNYMEVYVMKSKIVGIIFIFGLGLVMIGCSFSNNEPPPLVFPTLILTESPTMVAADETPIPTQTTAPGRTPTPTPQVEPTNTPTQTEFIPVIKFRPGRQATATRLA